jgi:hypothetical protein
MTEAMHSGYSAISVYLAGRRGLRNKEQATTGIQRNRDLEHCVSDMENAAGGVRVPQILCCFSGSLCTCYSLCLEGGLLPFLTLATSQVNFLDTPRKQDFLYL